MRCARRCGVSGTRARRHGLAAFAPAAGAVSAIQTGYWSALPAAPQVPSRWLRSGIQRQRRARRRRDPVHPRHGRGRADADAEGRPGAAGRTKWPSRRARSRLRSVVVGAAQRRWSGGIVRGSGRDCSGGLVTGTLSADGTTLSFDLSALTLRRITVDILLRPTRWPHRSAGCLGCRARPTRRSTRRSSP